jgi:hypothetical protein
MARTTNDPTSGIDDSSTIGEIDDAFGRKGVELAFRPVTEGWEAVISAQGAETLHCRAGSRLEAAREAWREYLDRNSGTGES